MIATTTQPLGGDRTSINLFYYRNSTNQLQIIRVGQTNQQTLEKIIFPGELLMFHASPNSQLEIQSRTTNGLTVVECFPCAQLQVFEKSIVYPI